MRGFWKGCLAVVVALVACDSTTEPYPLEVRVQTDTLEARGDIAQLVALTDGVIAASRWESLDPEVVTVTEGGLATAVAPGTARVRAEFGAAVDTGMVVVLPPVDIQISELAVVADPNGEQGLRLRVRNLGGRGYYRLEFWKLDPDGSTRRIVSYSSDMEVAPGLDIEHTNYLGDEIADWVEAHAREPLAQELARTSCARLDGGTPCPIEPTPAPLADSVSLSPGAAVLAVGEAVQYAAKAYANGAELAGRPVVWSTPSPDIIALSQAGVAVALRPGYGQVNATVDGITTGVGLTVTSPEPAPVDPPTVSSVAVRPRRVRLWVGQRWNLEAVAYDSIFQRLEGRPAAWAIDEGTAASVDAAGMVSATGHGPTRIAATIEGVNGYALVESYARPEGSAEMQYSGLLSAIVDPGTVMPSIPTTWTDSAGVVHDAWIQVGPGSMSMDWAETGRYTQRLILSTFVFDNPGVRKVAEEQYVDAGTVTRWHDYTVGEERFDFHSETTPGLVYGATWTLPGELAVEQPLGTASGPRSFYFRLPL